MHALRSDQKLLSDSLVSSSTNKITTEVAKSHNISNIRILKIVSLKYYIINDNFFKKLSVTVSFPNSKKNVQNVFKFLC